MNPTDAGAKSTQITSPVWPGPPIVRRNTYPVHLAVVSQDEGRRALAGLLERIDTRRRIDRAVREYEERVEADVPYEDLVDADELRARYGA